CAVLALCRGVRGNSKIYVLNYALCRNGRRFDLGRNRSNASEFLPLQCNISKQYRESKTNPPYSFDDVRHSVPTCDPCYYTNLKKDNRYGKAPGHPATVLLHLTLKNASKCDSGGDHPQGGVNCSQNSEAACASNSFLKVLNVKTQGSGDKDTS